jgi:hypothetical protein
MRCARCCHWTRESPFLGMPEWARGLPMDMGWGRCLRMDTGLGALDPTTLAWAADMEELRAWLMTRADFGCVMFTEKGEAA